MELDSLKALWQEQDQQVAEQDNRQEILAMLRKRSQNPIAKIKRNLRWELVAVIIVYSLAIWHYSVSWRGQYWEMAVLLFLVGASFVFYYYHKNKLLKQMQCVACEVRSNLQQQLKTLEKYIRFYYISGTLLMPVGYYVAGLIIFFKRPQFAGRGGNPLATRAQPMLTHITEHSYFTEFLVIGLVLTVGAYFLNGWYLNKMYGQHINRLKDLLRQMDDAAE
ncbi:MAG: hypothetical protein P0Y53_04870 [Candidatus Pseudobacter hemicellulosilyticus]|uniref:Uncharacterized protein n=1 Tax=Candidatus Pseudobacter hemicellulosilyticus TaxID=3121375 RepID=A0AAJ5WWF2_9BACT|nr:MAG: hypothetical protein P0Y53_04870 [Pseudobacter sp.]